LAATVSALKNTGASNAFPYHKSAGDKKVNHFIKEAFQVVSSAKDKHKLKMTNFYELARIFKEAEKTLKTIRKVDK